MMPVMERPAARTTAQRIADARRRLEHDVDLWVASAGADGAAYLVPLSFHWDGTAVTLATARTTRTARNLLRAGWARVALGETRDVVMVEGPVTEGADAATADAFAVHTDWDPRLEPVEYVFLRVEAREIQAWRESNELPGRRIMRAGAWVE